MGRKKGSKNKGLGDTIESITEATGIKKVVEKFTPEGKDCGCDKRKEILNKLFPYKVKAKCMNEEQYNWYKNFKETRTIKIEYDVVIEICKMYSELFNRPYWQPDCTNCTGTVKAIMEMINKLDTLFETYENN